MKTKNKQLKEVKGAYSKMKPPYILCDLHPYAYDDPTYFAENIERDIKVATRYFLKKKRNFIFTKEAKCLIPILYYEKLHKVNITKSLFSRSSNITNPEFIELKRNFNFIYKQVKQEKKLNFSLFLWSIYKTYHYFKKLNNERIIDKASFSLIRYLLDFGFLFFNHYEFEITEQPIEKVEMWFVRHVCALLSNDLIRTIVSGFPDYYSTNIMFLGYGGYIPAGCSSLDTSMNTFDSFLKGITDYDFWFDEELDGKDFLLFKLRINKNYETLTKEVFINEVS